MINHISKKERVHSLRYRVTLLLNQLVSLSNLAETNVTYKEEHSDSTQDCQSSATLSIEYPITKMSDVSNIVNVTFTIEDDGHSTIEVTASGTKGYVLLIDVPDRLLKIHLTNSYQIDELALQLIDLYYEYNVKPEQQMLKNQSLTLAQVFVGIVDLDTAIENFESTFSTVAYTVKQTDKLRETDILTLNGTLYEKADIILALIKAKKIYNPNPL